MPRRIMKYIKCLSSMFYATKIIKTFIKSRISANHDKMDRVLANGENLILFLYSIISFVQTVYKFLNRLNFESFRSANIKQHSLTLCIIASIETLQLYLYILCIVCNVTTEPNSVIKKKLHSVSTLH